MANRWSEQTWRINVATPDTEQVSNQKAKPIFCYLLISPANRRAIPILLLVCLPVPISCIMMKSPRTYQWGHQFRYMLFGMESVASKRCEANQHPSNLTESPFFPIILRDSTTEYAISQEFTIPNRSIHTLHPKHGFIILTALLNMLRLQTSFA